MINHIIKKDLIHQKPCDLSCLCCNFLFSTADFAISLDDLYVENNVWSSILILKSPVHFYNFVIWAPESFCLKNWLNMWMVLHKWIQKPIDDITTLIIFPIIVLVVFFFACPADLITSHCIFCPAIWDIVTYHASYISIFFWFIIF